MFLTLPDGQQWGRRGQGASPHSHSSFMISLSSLEKSACVCPEVFSCLREPRHSAVTRTLGPGVEVGSSAGTVGLEGTPSLGAREVAPICITRKGLPPRLVGGGGALGFCLV